MMAVRSSSGREMMLVVFMEEALASFIIADKNNHYCLALTWIPLIHMSTLSG